MLLSLRYVPNHFHCVQGFGVSERFGRQLFAQMHNEAVGHNAKGVQAS
jgi:hypothetical protein